MSEKDKRFVAFDVHKSYVTVGAVNIAQEVILPVIKVPFRKFEGWIAKKLLPTDEVVLEATTNAWHVYDLLEPLVSKVVVAHPYHVKLIASAVVKTDKRDTLNLARLLAAKMVPAVWVPPVEVRELRAIISHRERLISQQTAAKNRLRSVLHRHNIVPPSGGVFKADVREWWARLDVPGSEKLRIKQDLATLDHLKPLVAEVDQELARLSSCEPWSSQMTYIIQLPGFGLLTSMTVLSAIGDITRFSKAKKLVGYSGLASKVHSSGQTHRSGGITKQGRRELRAAMVEAAWVAVRHHPHWEDKFESLKYRIGSKKAIVAIARKLLVLVWNVLTAQETDRQANADKVAFKLMVWSQRLGAEHRQGLNTRQFTRYHLLKLGIGHDLPYVVRGGCKRLIAPVEEVLALRPELLASD